MRGIAKFFFILLIILPCFLVVTSGNHISAVKKVDSKKRADEPLWQPEPKKEPTQAAKWDDPRTWRGFNPQPEPPGHLKQAVQTGQPGQEVSGGPIGYQPAAKAKKAAQAGQVGQVQ